MFSLASSDPHPNIQRTLTFIQNWEQKHEDKETAKFILPAIYRPMSLIEPYVWKASASTTNGNEQAHRSINRDGVNLTLLAGIMRGYQYDLHAMSSIDLHITYGITSRDSASTHLHRAKCAVSQSMLSQQKRHDL
ncbi:hypothetical protein PAXINDRAFT_6931 [Paxillus involutus ATCC 200175]|nr:hypothetical protein PAXINDRAFT_6931 [Paxillus involutus ATCC 200175]